LSTSAAVDAEVRNRVAWLEQFHPDLMDCRVLVDVPHRHRQSGRQFHLRVEISVRSHDPLIIEREDADVYVAIHRAFDAARRRLEDIARERRGAVKTHH